MDKVKIQKRGSNKRFVRYRNTRQRPDFVILMFIWVLKKNYRNPGRLR